jgi:hypothetical protein
MGLDNLGVVGWAVVTVSMVVMSAGLTITAPIWIPVGLLFFFKCRFGSTGTCRELAVAAIVSVAGFVLAKYSVCFVSSLTLAVQSVHFVNAALKSPVGRYMTAKGLFHSGQFRASVGGELEFTNVVIGYRILDRAFAYDISKRSGFWAYALLVRNTTLASAFLLMSPIIAVSIGLDAVLNEGNGAAITLVGVAVFDLAGIKSGRGMAVAGMSSGTVSLALALLTALMLRSDDSEVELVSKAIMALVPPDGGPRYCKNTVRSVVTVAHIEVESAWLLNVLAERNECGFAIPGSQKEIMWILESVGGHTHHPVHGCIGRNCRVCTTRVPDGRIAHVSAHLSEISKEQRSWKTVARKARERISMAFSSPNLEASELMWPAALLGRVNVGMSNSGNEAWPPRRVKSRTDPRVE